jgi:predicted peptidase
MQPRVLTFVASDGTRMPYLLHLPPGHAGSARHWPLVLFLHGAGERGEDACTLLNTGLPSRLIGDPDFAAIVLSPQCARGTTWLDHQHVLMELVTEAEVALRADPARLHVTGLSLGGMGAWLLGSRHPRRFASVVPICGSVPPYHDFPDAVRALRDVPVWAFHGVEDPVVPVSHTLAMVDALERAGGRPRLTLYADVGHRSWEPAYDDPDLRAWFLGGPRR